MCVQLFAIDYGMGALYIFENSAQSLKLKVLTCIQNYSVALIVQGWADLLIFIERNQTNSSYMSYQLYQILLWTGHQR